MDRERDYIGILIHIITNPIPEVRLRMNIAEKQEIQPIDRVNSCLRRYFASKLQNIWLDIFILFDNSTPQNNLIDLLEYGDSPNNDLMLIICILFTVIHNH